MYVHCNGGKGRSVVVAIASLMVLHRWPLAQAFHFVRARRHVANMPRWGGVLPQWRSLLAFERSTFYRERMSPESAK